MKKVITSRHNEFFIQLKKLLSSSGIKKFNKSLVFGSKIIKELAIYQPEIIEALVIPKGFSVSEEILLRIPRMYEFSPELFNEIDIFNTKSPFLVVKVSPLPGWDGNFERGCSLFLPFQDPENIGSSLRSALAFGVTRVVILKEGANPYHPKAIRSSAGAVFKLKIFRGPSIKDLSPSLPIIALDAEGRDIRRISFPEVFGLLPGLEGPGLPEVWKAKAVKIPTTGLVESLNGATSVAIALYLWFCQLKLALG